MNQFLIIIPVSHYELRSESGLVVTLLAETQWIYT